MKIERSDDEEVEEKGKKKNSGGDDTEPDDIVPLKKGDQKKDSSSKGKGGKDEVDPKAQKLLETAYIIISFNMENPDNRVEYDIWFTSTDDRALDFINNFKEYDKILAENALMTPHYVTFDCVECDNSFKAKECFGNGKYCAINHKQVKMSGQQIILEDIRQSCIYNASIAKNNNADLFWKYIERAHGMCSEYINEDCSKTTHKDIGLSWEDTNACVDDTFGGDKKKKT